LEAHEKAAGDMEQGTHASKVSNVLTMEEIANLAAEGGSPRKH
jgi:hypothetical protein